jgi:hypothetical protein
MLTVRKSVEATDTNYPLPTGGVGRVVVAEAVLFVGRHRLERATRTETMMSV